MPFAATNSPGDYRAVFGFGSSTSGSFNITRPEIAFGIDPGANLVWFTKISGNNVDGNIDKSHIGTSGTLYGISGTYHTAT